LAIAAVVLVAGCGGDDESTGVATAPREAKPAQPAPDKTAPKKRVRKEKHAPRKETTAPTAGDDDVSQAVRRFVSAGGRLDRARLCRYLVSDLRRSCERGRSEILKAFMSSRSGDLAVADVNVRGASGGAKVHLRNRATFILRKEHGEWRVEKYRYPQKGRPVTE
jgi:hypothetical protein